ncbi:MAG: tetratricopeptide repeat protein [Bacteroidaceae bacterium]|nr:tetratricopeptide repeat protein [Bacteroidaceae bacterium]
MKRGFIILISLSVMLAATVSCGSARHASSDPISRSELDGYAADHFFKEGIRMYNENQYDAALDLMSHSLQYDTASAATCYSLAQYYMSMRDRALQEKYSGTAHDLLTRAVRLEPENYWYRRLLALSYLRMNRPIEAIEQYEEIARRFPGRTDVLLTLAGLYDDVGDYEKELRALERYGRLEDVADDLKFQRFVCYLQLGELDSAYYEAEKPAEIIELLMNSTRDMIEQAESAMDRIRCRSLLDVVMNFCDVVSAHEPELAEPYIQKSIAYFWMGENEESLDMLAKGLQNVRTDIDRAKIHNLRGDFYHTLGDKDKMYADYDSTLIYDPDNIGVLNNYAYYLSVEGRDLKRALEMSARTLEAEPLNATYLDTYAWILFKMKRYDEALGYMEKALRYLDTDNPEIYEHYGDVLFMCGEKEKALENWHKAVQFNSSSTTLDQKIKQEKYLE